MAEDNYQPSRIQSRINEFELFSGRAQDYHSGPCTKYVAPPQVSRKPTARVSLGKITINLRTGEIK